MTLEELDEELESMKNYHHSVLDDKTAWYPCRKSTERGEFEYAPGHLVIVVNEAGEMEYMFMTEDGRLVPVEDF